MGRYRHTAQALFKSLKLKILVKIQAKDSKGLCPHQEKVLIIGWYSMMQVFLVKKTTLFLFAAIVWVLGAITCGIYGVQLLNEGSDIQGIYMHYFH